jgi:hypothetical protein
MSIAFIPITAKSNLYNEEAVNKKWYSFLNNLSKSIESTSNIKINQDEFNSIFEKTLLKHYSIPSSFSPIKKEIKKEEKKEINSEENNEENSDENEEEIKKTETKSKIKKVESKETKKKKEEKPRCKQILKNNEQCKGKSTKGGEYCTRHTQKEESSEDDE